MQDAFASWAVVSDNGDRDVKTTNRPLAAVAKKKHDMKEIWFGHPEGLANLAAAVSHGKSPAKAVAYALELCRESVKALNRIALEEVGVTTDGVNLLSHDSTMERLAKIENWKKIVPKPDKFPATLDDFFRLVVKAKTTADSMKRLRDFYRQSSFEKDKDPQSRAANQIQHIKDGDDLGGFFTETKWELLAGNYLEWWKRKKSTVASISARQRKKNH